MKKLAIITTHPIQYNAPLFKLLTERGALDIKVFYTWGAAAADGKFDPGFGTSISWDIPLLQGYRYKFVKNVSADPGSHHFWGIDNPHLIQDVQAWQPSAILIYGWSFKSHLKLMKHFKRKVPMLFRGDSVSFNQSHGIRSLLRKIALKWVYKNVDYALYVGQHNKHYFIENGLKESQLLFAPHAIDNDRFLSGENPVIDFRQQLQIGHEAIVFLYAGKLDQNKNTASLAAAFKSIGKENVHLIIAGNGSQEERLRSLFTSADNIHFLPFQNQSLMPSLYASCDVFVLPSLTETWGLSVNEAMACSKAILVSNGCGCAVDLVQQGKNGYIFDLNDEGDLILRLSEMSRNKTSLEEMGKVSAGIISEWNFENTAKSIESLMLQITKPQFPDV